MFCCVDAHSGIEGRDSLFLGEALPAPQPHALPDRAWTGEVIIRIDVSGLHALGELLGGILNSLCAVDRPFYCIARRIYDNCIHVLLSFWWGEVNVARF